MKARAYISSVGMYVPGKVVTNEDLSKMVDTSDQWITERTGIRERRVVSDGETNSDLSARAIQACLDNAGISPDEIDLIIVPTVTPDTMFPSTACKIQAKIGASKAWGFDLSGACSGFIFGLATGAQFIENGTYKKVVVVGTDIMTSIVDPEDRATCVLFGDGSGAVLLEPSPDPELGLLDFHLRCDGSGAPYLHMPAGGSQNPASIETVEKRMHYVHQDGRTVFKFAVRYMAEASLKILKKNGFTKEDLDLLVPHQANLRIIKSIGERLKLREDQVAVNIERYANTTAATIPISLFDYMKAGKLNKGDLVVITSFGAGFTWGSALLRWGI